VATDAAKRPEAVPAARLVLARSYVERFRRAADPADLSAARAALVDLDGSRLAAADRTELIVGWGELFFLEGQPGLAAEMFDAALARKDLTTPVARDRMLDWWAQSLERVALADATEARQRIYERILARMDREQAQTPDSAAIIYWLAAAARGSGDVERAWHAARAGWVRAKLTQGGGASVRADLDRLVLDAIIPERARPYASAAEARKATAQMVADWDDIKRSW
jgi:hypothetical protein